MKKYFFIFSLFLITIVTVSANTLENKIKFNNLNSNDLLEYIYEFKGSSNRIKVCNQDYCDYLKYKNIAKSVQVYINDYINYVNKKTDDETSARVFLKGFLITDVIFY